MSLVKQSQKTHSDGAQHPLMTSSWTSQKLRDRSDEAEWMSISAPMVKSQLFGQRTLRYSGTDAWYQLRWHTGRRLQSACRRMIENGHPRARRHLIHLVRLDTAHLFRSLRAEYDDDDERMRSHAIRGLRWRRS